MTKEGLVIIRPEDAKPGIPTVKPVPREIPLVPNPIKNPVPPQPRSPENPKVPDIPTPKIPVPA